MARPKFIIKEYDPCPYCKVGTVTLRKGRFGSFYGCTQFPRCAFTQHIEEDDESKNWAEDLEVEQAEDDGLVFN